MNETPRQRAARLVRQCFGDDLERAQHAFKGMNDKQLDSPWGLSTKTPRQILAEYEHHRKLDKEALAWIEAQP